MRVTSMLPQSDVKDVLSLRELKPTIPETKQFLIGLWHHLPKQWNLFLFLVFFLKKNNYPSERSVELAVFHKHFCEEMAFWRTLSLDARWRVANAKQALAFFSFITVPSDGTGWSPHAKPNFCWIKSSTEKGVVPASWLLQQKAF